MTHFDVTTRLVINDCFNGTELNPVPIGQHSNWSKDVIDLTADGFEEEINKILEDKLSGESSPVSSVLTQATPLCLSQGHAGEFTFIDYRPLLQQLTAEHGSFKILTAADTETVLPSWAREFKTPERDRKQTPKTTIENMSELTPSDIILPVVIKTSVVQTPSVPSRHRRRRRRHRHGSDPCFWKTFGHMYAKYDGDLSHHRLQTFLRPVATFVSKSRKISGDTFDAVIFNSLPHTTHPDCLACRQKKILYSAILNVLQRDRKKIKKT